MSRPSSEKIRRVIDQYGHSEDAGPATLTPEQLAIQTERALGIVQRLSGAGRTAVLDDPVGTGKTVVALAAASELLRIDEVDNVLVVCPNAAVAERWRNRADSAGLPTAPRIGRSPRRGHHRLEPHARPGRRARWAARAAACDGGRGASRPAQRPEPAAPVSQGGGAGCPSPADHRNPVADERHGTAQHARCRTACARAGARQDSRARGGVRPPRRGRAPNRDWPAGLHRRATSKHEIARRRSTTPPSRTQSESGIGCSFRRTTATKAGLPKRFTLPPAQLVTPTRRLGRGLPRRKADPGALPASEEDAVRNSDTFMRMLVSSHAALRASRAWKRFLAAGSSGTARKLQRELQRQLGPRHPKVSFTARESLRRVREGRHVLIFCYFTATPAELENEIRAQGGHRAFRVERATNEAQARRVHHGGFNRPASATNPPIVLIVGDALSESVDLDGGTPRGDPPRPDVVPRCLRPADGARRANLHELHAGAPGRHGHPDPRMRLGPTHVRHPQGTAPAGRARPAHLTEGRVRTVRPGRHKASDLAVRRRPPGRTRADATCAVKPGLVALRRLVSRWCTTRATGTGARTTRSLPGCWGQLAG